MAIKNIIFDLGGVIIDIDYHRTLEAFRSLGAFNIDDVYTQSKQDSLFDDFDVGKITSHQFRSCLKSKLNINISDFQFDNAWNAMLLDLPGDRLDFIRQLRSKYRVFLFSNTNDIHLIEVFNICKRQNGYNSFDGVFEKEYYSNLVGFRKPNTQSFVKILNENELIPNETIFIDDSIQHVFGASQAGIYSIHFSKEQTIFDIQSLIDSATHRIMIFCLSRKRQYTHTL